MNTSKRTFLSLFLTGSIFISAKPLSETTAVIGAGIGGALAGATAGAGTYLALQKQENEVLKLGASALAALGATGLTGYALYAALHTMTPPGRIAAASNLIDGAAHDSLVCNDFVTSTVFVAHVTSRFGTGWPLVLALEHYRDLKQNLEAAGNLINLAYQEASRDRSYSFLLNKCEELMQAARRMGSVIDARINAILAHEKYDIQIQLYEKHQEAERKRAHEQLLLLSKLAHDSIERERDREHDSNERNKDRVEKQGQKNDPKATAVGKTDEQKNIEYALHELQSRKKSHGFSRMWKGIILSQIAEIRNKNASMADAYQEQYNNIVKGGGFLEDAGAVEEMMRDKTRLVENALFDLDRVVKGARKDVFDEWQKLALQEINRLASEQDRVYYKKVYDVIMARRTA